jgi:hypothetical protein
MQYISQDNIKNVVRAALSPKLVRKTIGGPIGPQQKSLLEEQWGYNQRPSTGGRLSQGQRRTKKQRVGNNYNEALTGFISNSMQ